MPRGGDRRSGHGAGPLPGAPSAARAARWRAPCGASSTPDGLPFCSAAITACPPGASRASQRTIAAPAGRWASSGWTPTGDMNTPETTESGNVPRHAPGRSARDGAARAHRDRRPHGQPPGRPRGAGGRAGPRPRRARADQALRRRRVHHVGRRPAGHRRRHGPGHPARPGRGRPVPRELRSRCRRPAVRTGRRHGRRRRPDLPRGPHGHGAVRRGGRVDLPGDGGDQPPSSTCRTAPAGWR